MPEAQSLQSISLRRHCWLSSLCTRRARGLTLTLNLRSCASRSDFGFFDHISILSWRAVTYNNCFLHMASKYRTKSLRQHLSRSSPRHYCLHRNKSRSKKNQYGSCFLEASWLYQIDIFDMSSRSCLACIHTLRVLVE